MSVVVSRRRAILINEWMSRFVSNEQNRTGPAGSIHIVTEIGAAAVSNNTCWPAGKLHTVSYSVFIIIAIVWGLVRNEHGEHRKR